MIDFNVSWVIKLQVSGFTIVIYEMVNCELMGWKRSTVFFFGKPLLNMVKPIHHDNLFIRLFQYGSENNRCYVIFIFGSIENYLNAPPHNSASSVSKVLIRWPLLYSKLCDSKILKHPQIVSWVLICRSVLWLIIKLPEIQEKSFGY